jgi:anti-sigma factor RsiW
LAELCCQELVEAVSAYIEGALPAERRARLEAHLAVCDPCVTYVDQFRVTIERSGHLNAEDLSPQTQAELLHIFRGWNAA